MKNIHFLIAFAVLGLLSACNGQSKNVDQQLKEIAADKDINVGNMNFTFTLPAGWFRLDTTVSGIKLCYLVKQNDDLHPMLNVTTEAMHKKTHKDYVAGTTTYLIGNGTTDKLLSEGQFEAGDKDCLWYTYNKAPSLGGREMVYYSIGVNEISYNITAGVNPSGRDKYKQTFDEIVKSFRLVN